MKNIIKTILDFVIVIDVSFIGTIFVSFLFNYLEKRINKRIPYQIIILSSVIFVIFIVVYLLIPYVFI